MKIVSVTVAVLLMCLACFGQAPATIQGDKYPHLEFGVPTLNLNGAGFQPVSASVTGGFGMEDVHYFWHVSGTYDAAAKASYCVYLPPPTRSLTGRPLEGLSSTPSAPLYDPKNPMTRDFASLSAEDQHEYSRQQEKALDAAHPGTSALFKTMGLGLGIASVGMAAAAGSSMGLLWRLP